MSDEGQIAVAKKRSRLRWLKFLLIPAIMLAMLAFLWPTMKAHYLASEIRRLRGENEKHFEWGIEKLLGDVSWFDRARFRVRFFLWRQKVEWTRYLEYQLEVCDLDGTEADAAFVQSVCSTGTITDLKVRGLPIDDNVFEWIAENELLEVLALTKTQITGAGIDKLRQLHKLRTLDLSDTAITDDTMKSLVRCPSLTALDIKSCHITDRGLEYLSQCHTLNSIDLRDTSITEKGLNALSALPTLRFLKISKSQIPLLRGVDFDSFPDKGKDSFPEKLYFRIDCKRSDIDWDDLDFLLKLEEVDKINWRVLDDPLFK